MRKLSLAFLAGTALAAWSTTSALASSTILLQHGNVIATGSTIYLNRLPIRLPDGKFIYKDVTIQLQADDAGVVSDVSPIAQRPSFPLPIAFKAGTYLLGSDARYGFLLSGPSPVPATSVAKWEANAAASKSLPCGTPAIFYNGPLSPPHPLAARLKAAGITSMEYSYGVVAQDPACIGVWNRGFLVGFAQAGPNLTIASFTDSSGKDHNTPQAFLTYRAQLP